MVTSPNPLIDKTPDNQAFPIRKRPRKPVVDLERLKRKPIFQLYLKRLTEIEFSSLSRVKKAEVLGVGRSTLLEWDHSGLIDWSEINDKVRSNFLQMAPAVYTSLVRAALGGDVAAQRLFFERFEAWSQRSTLELTAKRSLDHMTDDQLLLEAVQGATEAERAKLLGVLAGYGAKVPMDAKESPNDCHRSTELSQGVIDTGVSTEAKANFGGRSESGGGNSVEPR